MNLKKLKSAIIRSNAYKGNPDADIMEGCVDYDTAAWLFKIGFNEPCETFFNRVDEFANSSEGTPEYLQWESRETNWKKCSGEKFINYPEHSIMKSRFARPTYIQVLEWFEEKFYAKIDVSAYQITVKNLHIPQDQDNYYVESWDHINTNPPYPPVCDFQYLAGITIKMIIDRFKLLAKDFVITY